MAAKNKKPQLQKERLFYRAVFLFVLILLCICGIAVRRRNGISPDFFNTYFPDAAWTMAVYCGFGLLFCKGIRVNLPAALLVSYLVECSQLLHTPALDALRATRIGGLMLGYGFLRSDLLCYTVGALFCAGAEYIFAHHILKK